MTWARLVVLCFRHGGTPQEQEQVKKARDAQVNALLVTRDELMTFRRYAFCIPDQNAAERKLSIMNAIILNFASHLYLDFKNLNKRNIGAYCVGSWNAAYAEGTRVMRSRDW